MIVRLDDGEMIAAVDDETGDVTWLTDDPEVRSRFERDYTALLSKKEVILEPADVEAEKGVFSVDVEREVHLADNELIRALFALGYRT